MPRIGAAQWQVRGLLVSVCRRCDCAASLIQVERCWVAVNVPRGFSRRINLATAHGDVADDEQVVIDGALTHGGAVHGTGGLQATRLPVAALVHGLDGVSKLVSQSALVGHIAVVDVAEHVLQHPSRRAVVLCEFRIGLPLPVLALPLLIDRHQAVE